MTEKQASASLLETEMTMDGAIYEVIEWHPFDWLYRAYYLFGSLFGLNISLMSKILFSSYTTEDYERDDDECVLY